MKWEEIDREAKRVALRITSELTEVETEKQADGEQETLVRELLDTDLLQAEAARRKKYDYQRAFRQIRNQKRRLLFRWMSGVAALIALALGGVILLWPEGRQAESVAVNDTGKQQVTLLLSDGKSVSLGNADTLQLQDGSKIIEIQKGGINYAAQQNQEGETAVHYHTLTVPPGGEYQVILSDGTIIHLNAASKLKYPVVFSKEKREVELQGEAWFEVKQEAAHPFYVRADEVQIRVYGTQFNVNTYRLKTVETVLVEGCIGIKTTGMKKELQLHPGQLAEFERSTGMISLKEVDVRPYIAWKEGVFYFNDESLEEIMNELARWYDVEVFFYSGKARELHFSGHLERYEDIRRILSTITESTGVVFSITGKTIVVK